MSALIFIGTLHYGITPKDELLKLIENFNPTLLLVEICQKDIETDSIEEYPDEMKAALTWGNRKHIKVYGFDSEIEPLRKGVSEEDLKNLNKEQMEIIKRHDWKDFNTVRLVKTLRTKSWHKVIDEDKDIQRELEMYRNIIHLINDPDVTIVVTGAGHIPFFRNKFPTAQFPLSALIEF